ncbi:amidohydrolase family protein [Novosphingobium album (ex Liu et al. 2023)]|uniref:Amidohydrolase family protein n=1 Tax=Novosphingobium album (ex Liu et al. 2023) TaxID=3031130 RepID=A0ABT5WUI1_9SPHN|nr:amidohydrolase family protein [Novosphingobium album (ex Liu et al. 2023)]MDE8653559.1 amidohydrolase family protein [Novosphingobium album (ex Liu et al. 2023)]
MTFVFSADGHITEPSDLLTEGLPPSLRPHGIRAEVRDGYMYMLAGEKVTSKRPINKPPLIMGKDGQEFGRANRKGAREIPGRLEDMEMEGIDAEIVFPSLALTAFHIRNEDAELATAQVYNDWHHAMFAPYQSQFVRCGVLPVRNFANTVAEMKRLAAMGFTSAMLPSRIEAVSGLPFYTEPAWDPVFEAAQELGIVFVLHTGTGREDVRSFRGPGGAVINYTIQACDAQETVMQLVAGGVLDRFPRSQVACIESGASWLAALAERMDEVYHAHDVFVRPKLSRMPSRIISEQVSASFQYDRACVMSRSVTGVKPLLWGSDYPHHEGTFPESREVVARLFDGIEISEQDKADILGLNAARLFRLPRPELALQPA